MMMAIRKGIYLAALAGSIAFYIAYQEWFSTIVLWLVVGLPLFSLLVSLPAMLTFRMKLSDATVLSVGDRAELHLIGNSKLPLPPFGGTVRLRRRNTGEQWSFSLGGVLPTDHCGALQVTVERARVYDYLGLISFPVRHIHHPDILVRPHEIDTALPPDLKRFLSRPWRPKAAGGFSEQHELRPFHPGDSLNQVHWKLTAKLGDLMLREAMQPDRDRILLTLDIQGNAVKFDRAYGELLHLGAYLLELAIPFELEVLTADGVHTLLIASNDDLAAAVDRCLCFEPSTALSLKRRKLFASWRYHIGGETNEAN